jgi:hypothetical protein
MKKYLIVILIPLLVFGLLISSDTATNEASKLFMLLLGYGAIALPILLIIFIIYRMGKLKPRPLTDSQKKLNQRLSMYSPKTDEQNTNKKAAGSDTLPPAV